MAPDPEHLLCGQRQGEDARTLQGFPSLGRVRAVSSACPVRDWDTYQEKVGTKLSLPRLPGLSRHSWER